MKIKPVEWNEECLADRPYDAVSFKCPGCKNYHVLPIKGLNKYDGPIWHFDGNFEAPTLSPSILATTEGFAGDKDWPPIPKEVCHSFVRNGRIEFLDDCTHILKGQIATLPDVQ